MPHDYCSDRPIQGRSLSHVARQIEIARREVPNCLLLDNGDFLQGNPLADYVAAAPRRRRPHPVITAFNTLGYDAATLGNHEFDYGLGFLQHSLKAARFPVVSANITTRLGTGPARDITLVQPYAILRRMMTDEEGRQHRLRIGVIGFAPPQIEIWDRDHLDGKIRMRDILSAARAWLPRMRAEGADVIIALAHSGIGPAHAEAGMENAATALAALPEIDAVIAGHSHLAFPGPAFAATDEIDPVRGRLSGKPAVMPGHSGSHVGLIDLHLTRTPAGPRRWSVRDSTASLVGGSAVPKAGKRGGLIPKLRQAIQQDHRGALAWSRSLIGIAAVPLSTYFATTAPSAALQLIAEAKAEYARKALAGTAWAQFPLLASAAPFRAGGRAGPENYTSIPAGGFLVRHLSDLYAYPNKLVVLAMTGAHVADWLEQSAALFHVVRPGDADAPLHNAAIPSFTFDVIPGLTYAIDLTRPPRFSAEGHLLNPASRRVVGLALDGRPLDPDRPVLLVTNNHRASRAIAESNATGLQVALSAGMPTRAALTDHIRKHSRVGTPALQNWRFLPMPGTTVRVATGPGAAAHLDDIAGYRPVDLGRDNDGFQNYRLHL